MSDIKIQIIIDDQIINATLWENNATTSLIQQLPLTLTFNDYNAVEKTAHLPSALDLTGLPKGAEPQPGEIGYYAPNQVLVLYYDKVSYWPGIVRLGRFEVDPRVIEQLPEGAIATLQVESHH